VRVPEHLVDVIDGLALVEGCSAARVAADAVVAYLESRSDDAVVRRLAEGRRLHQGDPGTRPRLRVVR
jgi:hypothetical protein